MEPRLLSIAITMWLAALAAIVLMRILDGSIRTDGLLCERPGGDISPERIQLLIATLSGAAIFAANTFSQSLAGDKIFADVPDLLLTGMAGSQVLYLSGKLMRRIYRGDGK